MNGDNSQQSEDNWVQKTVRNLEGMNRARQVSANQGNDKPMPCSSRDPKNSSAQVSVIIYVSVDILYTQGHDICIQKRTWINSILIVSVKNWK